MTAKIKLNAASGGGSISIQAPSSSSNNRVISLPDIADGTLLTSQSSLDSTKLSPAITGGKILQVVSTTQTSVSSVSVGSGLVGDLGPQVTITPSSSSNKVLITSAIEVSCEIGQINHDYVLQANGSTVTAAIGDSAGSRRRATGTNESYHSESSATLIINFLHSANTTSAVTYGIRVGHSSSSTRTIYCNRSGSDGNDSKIGRYTSTITAMEVAA